MKFGRNLPRNQVPEWASSYINYKGLKKLIKAAATEDKQEDKQGPDLAGFFYTLDRNLEDVDHFYNKKFQDFSRRRKLLEDRYGPTLQAAAQLDPDEREDLLAALLELRGQLRKLQWYGEVNRRGFIKITKKLDKRIPTANAQKKYLELKVDPSPFATNAELFSLLARTNDGISVLGDIAPQGNLNDDGASVSSGSLQRATSRPTLDISSEQLAKVESGIRQDDSDSLDEWIRSLRRPGLETSEAALQYLLNTLLQRAISCRSHACTARLLREIVFLDAQDDINRRNCIHRLIVSIGRKQSDADHDPAAEPFPDAETELYNFITPAKDPITPFKRSVLQDDQRSNVMSREDAPIAFLQFLLDNLQPSQRPALMARDIAGRTPLHFAAEYGIRVMCEIILEHLSAWKMFDVSGGIDGPRWQDNEGWAPLHLSVIGGHPLTTQALLDAERRLVPDGSISVSRRKNPKSAAVLAMATKANYVDVVRLLVKAGVDINYQDEQGDTALHVAARFGHLECSRLLIAGSPDQKANIELCEYTYSWTPLFIACVDGHLSIAELLIESGADLDRLDSSGWNAKEHAALRGHVDIATKLNDVMVDVDDDDEDNPALSTSVPTNSSLTERSSNGIGSQAPTVKISEPVKSFGHRYLTDKSMILVSLGTMDSRKAVKAVNLDRIPLSSAHSTQLDTALSIVVSARFAEGEAEVIDLPVHDNIATEPIVFHATDPSKVKLLFDLIPTYAGSKERIVGRGVALLSTVQTSLGTKRMPLQGDVTVPIVAANDLEVIGSITFNFLVITPFSHPNMSVTENQTYWRSMASTMLIGHRGLGKNFSAGRRSLQLGENTIQSFIAAANLGASYVEFDVQLTKDHVPVIYHDFLVSETGIDAPVHTLTLEQFLHINDMRSPRHSRPASPIRVELPKVSSTKGSGLKQSRLRSMSLGGSDSKESQEMDERMKHTRDFKKKGFKGNSRGNHIQAPFATLEEMFRKIPADVGFNIEMKYPMLYESEDEEMDSYAVELNSFVDTVLTKVYDLGKGRNIIFSSFNPNICLLLSFKQPSIPVLFLTDAGTSPVGDIRATSLQEGIRFASRWNLLGVVSAAEPLVAAPRLVRVVKESGLVCVSYGVLNNDSAMVRKQVKQGIDAVIVDSVLAIRRGLTGETSSKGKPTEDAPSSVNGAAAAAPDRLKAIQEGADNNRVRSLEQKFLASTESLEIPVVAESDEGVVIPVRSKGKSGLVNGTTPGP